MFNKYGVMNQYRSLACGDILKWEAVGLLPLSDCFTELCIQSDEARYQRNYRQIQDKK